MTRWQFKSRAFDYLATGLLILATGLWIFWGVRGLYHGGWWDAWYYRLLYLLPGAISLALTLLSLSRPIVAGWLIAITGSAFTAYWWWYIAVNIGLSWERLWFMLPISGTLVIAGVFIILGRRRRAASNKKQSSPSGRWFYRNRKYVLVIGLPLLLAVTLAIAIPPADEFRQISNPSGETEGYSEGELFRNSTVQFVRTVAIDYFAQQPTPHPEELDTKGNWDVEIAIYHQGEIKGNGAYEGKDETLSSVLEAATYNALEASQDLNENELEDARFLITFWYNPSFFDQIKALFLLFPYDSYLHIRSSPVYDHSYSVIEYQGEGKELMANLVIIRTLDKELMRQNIEQGKEFLLRAENEDEHGFYKKYEALDDDFGNRLYTVYSASIIYTLLKVYDFDQDERIMESLSNWGDFLLSMQSKDEETYGAFHYSYYYETEVKQLRFVVGTTALSIFTLLDLYQRTGDTRYLQSAELGGDWLTTMQKPDGVMKAYQEYRGGKWVYGEDESLLYNGQVLSALSRLYAATAEEKYYDTAEKIAQHFAARVEEEGCYLGDDYRPKNTISSAWVVMSLLDFYKVNQDDYYKDIIFTCSRDILERQERDSSNLVYYATWHRAYSTSGNAWLAEVMIETYNFCQECGRDGCDDYKQAVIRAILWLSQNTYSAENTFLLKEPENAIGGIFWNYENSYVRTDSLCHGLNAYIAIVQDWDDGLILSVPEEPFHIILNMLRN